ncbi:MAG TPA: hypothetical protein VEY91_06540 [Candidatus Limnocylindria bacterium]|nr:hypothetical protein [Candidatus Limnocylindria bacterium]
MRALVAAGFATALAAGLALAVSPAASRLETARVLEQRLTRHGRAEAQVVHALADALGAAAPRRARLALEPGLVRLDFTDDGERVTLREDGGEWLQPGPRQILLLPSDQIAGAAAIWNALLGSERDRFTERRIASNRFLLTPSPALAENVAAPFESLWVTLGQDRLPSRIEVRDASGQLLRLRFSGWRFAAARGPTAFRLAAPKGYAVVPMR